MAAEWKLPLIRLDPSNLYNRYVGESEKNLKRAIKLAEKRVSDLNRAWREISGSAA